MARVAVLHNTLDFQGGADVVCLSACAALQAEHAVTLYTISETDPGDLAARFGIDLDTATLDVRMPTGAEPIARLLSAGAPTIGPQLALRSVLLRRAVGGQLGAFDLVVSTANEMSLPTPSVQYVHYPQFRTHRLPDGGGGGLNRVWSRLAAPRPDDLDDGTTLLVNSAWTAGVAEDVYGVRPTVVYPPVDPIDGVRDRGHDLHLHIVGAAPRAYRRYVQKVESLAAERSYVAVERDAPRARLEELLCTHKYGLNCKPAEHFGMSVAEYVASGMVAFAPDSGGQQEILDKRTDRLFGSVPEAVDRVAAAAAADDPPALPPDRFASDRFRRAIRDAVERAL